MSLFWSIRPLEEVMRDGAEMDSLEELQCGNITLLVADMGNRVRIERVMSPFPRDYLDPRWQPGNVMARGAWGSVNVNPSSLQ